MKSVIFVHVRKFIDLTSPELLFLSFFFFFLAFKFSYFRKIWSGIRLNKVKVNVTQSCPTVSDHQAPVSLEFSRQEQWIPSPGVLPDPGIEPGSPALQADSLPSKPPGKSLKILYLRSNLGEGNDTPLQYSCLENPIDRGTWWAAVHGVLKSRTWLSDWTELKENWYTWYINKFNLVI